MCERTPYEIETALKVKVRKLYLTDHTQLAASYKFRNRKHAGLNELGIKTPKRVLRYALSH